MTSKALWRSFAGGEITPELLGRLDLTKYQTGLARCRNFRTLPHGPAERRPGFGFVGESQDSTRRVRILPFAFNATQTVVLEFSHQAIRFFINGSALVETGVAIASIVGSLVTTTGAHGFASGEDVFIGTRFHRVTVTGTNTFTTADRWGTATTAAGTTAARVYTLATPYADTDLFDLHFAQDSDVFTIAHVGYPSKELRRLGAVNWALTDISFAPTMTTPTGVGVAATIPTATNPSPQRYVVTALASDGVTESLASSVVTASNNLTIAGNYNTISWGVVTGASRYNVYKQRGGSFGYIGQTVSLSVVDDNVTADTTKTPPENVFTLNASVGNYPSAVTYFEQRRAFAGTTNDPQTVWATRSGTQSNLTSSIPSQDDDGMQFRIRAQQQNAIRHLLPLADLIALTVGGEFRIFSDGGASITPTSLSVKPQGYSGASQVQPVLTSGSLLYVQSQGSRVREMAYNWQSSSYASIDISIMAPHLFNTFTLVDLAYTRAPVQSFYAVRSDGKLLGMTYVPEQQVYGWHQHDTDGLFESVCTVSEGMEDVLYAVVKRTINGRSVRNIERLRSSMFGAQANAFFVDSGLTYSGAPVSSLSGLWHLEGKTVQVLADGAVHPTRVVVGGGIALETPASIVHVGLPYVSDMTTLPLVLQDMPAGSQGFTKNVNGVRLRVTNSSVVAAGPSFDKLTEYPARNVTDPYDAPPALRTGELRFTIGPSWNSDGQVCLRQTAPLPLTVLALALDVAPGG